LDRRFSKATKPELTFTPKSRPINLIPKEEGTGGGENCIMRMFSPNVGIVITSRMKWVGHEERI
jgi:hypothetical protein